MFRRISHYIAVAFSVAVVACAAPPPAPVPPANDAPADIAAIGAVRSAFVAAYNAGDAEAIGKLYTADAISEPDHQPSLEGRDAIVKSLTAMFGQVTLEVELTPDETKTIGDSGFDRGRYRATVTSKAGGPSTTQEGRYLVLFVKEADGAWRVARDIDNSSTPISAAAPASAEASK